MTAGPGDDDDGFDVRSGAGRRPRSPSGCSRRTARVRAGATSGAEDRARVGAAAGRADATRRKHDVGRAAARLDALLADLDAGGSRPPDD